MADVELTAEEVRHVAALARLGLDDAEVERLGREAALANAPDLAADGFRVPPIGA